MGLSLNRIDKFPLACAAACLLCSAALFAIGGLPDQASGAAPDTAPAAAEAVHPDDANDGSAETRNENSEAPPEIVSDRPAEGQTAPAESEQAPREPSVPAPPQGQAQRSAAVFTRGPAWTGAIALTFDDGPHPTYTPRLLEILKAEGVPATFFLLGDRIELYPEVAALIAAQGFEIGNHSFSHADATTQTGEEIRAEVERTQKLIHKATGRRPTLYRPPYGKHNDALFAVLHEESMAAVNWSVDPRDWQRGETSESIRDFILGRAHPGAIVLLHDIHKRSVEAVPEIIAGLREQGFTFVTAGELVANETEDRARRRAAADRAESQQVGTNSDGAPQTSPTLSPAKIPLSITKTPAPVGH